MMPMTYFQLEYSKLYWLLIKLKKSSIASYFWSPLSVNTGYGWNTWKLFLGSITFIVSSSYTNIWARRISNLVNPRFLNSLISSTNSKEIFCEIFLLIRYILSGCPLINSIKIVIDLSILYVIVSVC